ncbi:MAG: hypothetical protein ACJ8F3_12115 [Xanthobacteraceae bacterium]
MRSIPIVSSSAFVGIVLQKCLLVKQSTGRFKIRRANAQQPEQMRQIGVLLINGPEPMGPFREALRELARADEVIE